MRAYLIFEADMRFVFILVLSLFSFLLKNSGPAYAAGHTNAKISSPPLRSSDSTQQINLGYLSKGYPVIKHEILNDKKEDLINVDDNEDEPVFSRKSVLISKAYLALNDPSLLIELHNSSCNRLPICRHFSYTSTYTYLLQRVLRL